MVGGGDRQVDRHRETPRRMTREACLQGSRRLQMLHWAAWFPGPVLPLWHVSVHPLRAKGVPYVSSLGFPLGIHMYYHPERGVSQQHVQTPGAFKYIRCLGEFTGASKPTERGCSSLYTSHSRMQPPLFLILTQNSQNRIPHLPPCTCCTSPIHYVS